MTSFDEPSITPRDAAVALNCSELAVRRWISERKLKAFRLGRLIRIHRKDLEAFIASRQATETCGQQ